MKTQTLKFNITRLNIASICSAAMLILIIGSGALVGCDDSDSESTSSSSDQAVSGEMSEMGGEMNEMGGEMSEMSEMGGEMSEMGGEAPEDPETPTDADPPYEHPEYAEEMLVLVNNFRAEGGTCGGETLPSVPPLALQRQLNDAARDHAADMAAQGYFDHQSLDGRSPADRMRARGYQGSAYGENIAAGNESAYDTFVQWRESPGHCVNMLSDSYTELGVGYVRAPFSSLGHYWVQNFGRP